MTGFPYPYGDMESGEDCCRDIPSAHGTETAVHVAAETGFAPCGSRQIPALLPGKPSSLAVTGNDPGAHHRACETIHIGSQYYVLEFAGQRKAADMSFRKDRYQVGKSEALSGKNLMVSGNQDWATEEIVQLSLDRYGVG